MHHDQLAGTLARHYYGGRDLGQTFAIGDQSFVMTAITVRLPLVDVAKVDPGGTKVPIQLMRVIGEPRIKDNNTNATNASNGPVLLRRLSRAMARPSPRHDPLSRRPLVRLHHRTGRTIPGIIPTRRYAGR